MKKADMLTIEEKAALLEGYETWRTNPIPRLDIRSLFLTDGPHGLRRVRETGSGFAVSNNEHSTSFPTAVAVASSWNTGNAYDIGKAIAEECIEAGVDVLLAPGVNIKRNPLCGRNFEYFSEDPFVSGVFGESFVKGVQSLGVGCSVKHFAANSNENYRFIGNSIVDERALMEIYLRAFERIIKKAKPFTVMCSYNRLNGVFASQNKKLLTDILRGMWGFDGLVMTDWGATCDRLKGIKAGSDLDMPGNVWHNRKSIINAVRNGELSEEDIDTAIDRVLTLVNNSSEEKKDARYSETKHVELACDIAKDSAVLLKNDGILPLKGNERILIVGEMFEKLRYQGAGSSLINPPSVVSAKAAFDKRNIEYTYEKGYRAFYQKDNPSLIKNALRAAEEADIVLFFGGLTDFEESEGFDRQHMRIDKRQRSLLKSLTDMGRKVVFVLHAGAPVEIPCYMNLSAVLNMHLPGMHGGEATAALLYGERVPSGKLAESWTNCTEDTSCFADYNRSATSKYYESIYVGYRFYDKAKTNLQFPFGYGLSYTSFEYGNISVVENKDEINITADITNSGDYDGAEVVQLYVRNNKSDVFKAEKELRAFSKVFIKKGETEEAKLAFNKRDLAYWNIQRHEWVLENGLYEICLAASSADVRLCAPLRISDGEEVVSPYSKKVTADYLIPPRDIPGSFTELTGYTEEEKYQNELTLESSLLDFKKTFIGRIFYLSVMAVVKKQYRKTKRMKDSLERDALLKNSYFVVRMMPGNSLRAMCMSSGGKFSYNTAMGMLEIANGHFVKGMKYIFKKERVLPLPVNKQGDRI